MVKEILFGLFFFNNGFYNQVSHTIIDLGTKFDAADKKDSQGENKPKAAAVLSGGTTLTGQSRDTIEIDPMMRVRPGQPDPTKDKDKDKKKEEDKSKK